MDFLTQGGIRKRRRSTRPDCTGDFPAITGTTVVGQTLSCSEGTWDNDPTLFFYEWEGATGAPSGSSYVLQAGDVGRQLRVRVTATNDDGPGHFYTAFTTPITAT